MTIIILNYISTQEELKIFPEMAYCDALEHFRFPTLFQRREDMCNKLFTKIIDDPAHRLHHLLSPKSETGYDLRSNRHFNMYNIRTNRFQNSFIASFI